MASVTVVEILGVMHDSKMQSKYHYPRSLMEELIQHSAANVICREVHPQSQGLYAETGIWGETQEEHRKACRYTKTGLVTRTTVDATRCVSDDQTQWVPGSTE